MRSFARKASGSVAWQSHGITFPSNSLHPQPPEALHEMKGLRVLQLQSHLEVVAPQTLPTRQTRTGCYKAHARKILQLSLLTMLQRFSASSYFFYCFSYSYSSRCCCCQEYVMFKLWIVGIRTSAQPWGPRPAALRPAAPPRATPIPALRGLDLLGSGHICCR